MKKAIVLGLVVLLVIGSAVAAHAKAQKADLKDVEGNTVGFVIFNNPDPTDIPIMSITPEGVWIDFSEGNETNIKVVVSLKKGSPTTTYPFSFYGQGPGGVLSIDNFGVLTTNPRGKGNWTSTSEDPWSHAIVGPPGQWEIYVTVGGIFTSDTVTLNLKT